MLTKRDPFDAVYLCYSRKGWQATYAGRNARKKAMDFCAEYSEECHVVPYYKGGR
ncbi:MAG: hypothetical protein FWB90_00655 [Fibromonadales bacterium]|nr:hypothetical protein [Fibromonadales bacterium]